MELSADKNYCFNLNQPLEESVMIDQLPVVTGSYMDLLFVSFCYFLIDSQSYQPYFDNLFAIMKNLYEFTNEIDQFIANILGLLLVVIFYYLSKSLSIQDKLWFTINSL